MVPGRGISEDLGSLWCEKEYGVAGGIGVCGLGEVGYLGRLGDLNCRDAWWLIKWEKEGPSECMETQKAKGATRLCDTEN